MWLVVILVRCNTSCSVRLVLESRSRVEVSVKCSVLIACARLKANDVGYEGQASRRHLRVQQLEGVLRKKRLCTEVMHLVREHRG